VTGTSEERERESKRRHISPDTGTANKACFKSSQLVTDLHMAKYMVLNEQPYVLELDDSMPAIHLPFAVLS